jgi:hypothetical protein
VRALRTVLISAVLALGLAAFAGPAAAQTTTTTMPPVRSIPVTPAPGVTTTTSTTARPAAAVSGETAAAPPMADTGLAADKLVPLGLLLIGLGAALTGAARRTRRPAYAFTL